LKPLQQNIAGSHIDRKIDLRLEKHRKILLVRPDFRLSKSILTLPSIQLFRNNCPNAKIAFGESPSSRALCANLPIDKHYPVWKVPRIVLGLSGISRFHAGMELLNRAEIR
jgi:hypothetical protein